MIIQGGYRRVTQPQCTRVRCVYVFVKTRILFERPVVFVGLHTREPHCRHMPKQLKMYNHRNSLHIVYLWELLVRRVLNSLNRWRNEKKKIKKTDHIPTESHLLLLLLLSSSLAPSSASYCFFFFYLYYLSKLPYDTLLRARFIQSARNVVIDVW